MASLLPVPNLTIKDFRGIDYFDAPRFDRFTLLVGKNGIGKTTILDAIKLLGLSAPIEAVNSLLVDRDETISGRDVSGALNVRADVAALFNSDDPSRTIRISTTTKGIQEWNLAIQIVHVDGNSEHMAPLDGAVDALRVTLNGRIRHARILLTDADRDRFPNGIPPATELKQDDNNNLPTSIQPPFRLTSIGAPQHGGPHVGTAWDQITLQPAEVFVKEILGTMLGRSVEGIAPVSGGWEPRAAPERRFIIKLSDAEKTVPLRRLGNGAVRLFELAVAMATAEDGILLIDEFENGLHYSIQPEIWSALFRAARAANVQIIATTHSLDCVRAFATATMDDENDDRLVLRLSRRTGDLRPVEYRGEDLQAAAKHDIEMR